MLYTLSCIEDGDFGTEFVADLTVLLHALETPDPSWARDFHNGLAGLDEDLAVANFELEDEGDAAPSKEPSFDEETSKRVRATAARLKLLVLTKIEGPLDDPESTD